MGKTLFDTQQDDDVDRVALEAHKLTVLLSDDEDIPSRYKKNRAGKKQRKPKEDALIEKRFKDNVKAWTQVIEVMLAKIETQQAWRFIELSPEVAPGLRKVTECQDFLDFFDYFSRRRDKEEACPEEVGALSWLLTLFQRKIEEQIKS